MDVIHITVMNRFGGDGLICCDESNLSVPITLSQELSSPSKTKRYSD